MYEKIKQSRICIYNSSYNSGNRYRRAVCLKAHLSGKGITDMEDKKISEEENFDVSMMVLAIVTLISLFGAVLL